MVDVDFWALAQTVLVTIAPAVVPLLAGWISLVLVRFIKARIGMEHFQHAVLIAGAAVAEAQRLGVLEEIDGAEQWDAAVSFAEVGLARAGVPIKLDELAGIIELAYQEQFGWLKE